MVNNGSGKKEYHNDYVVEKFCITFFFIGFLSDYIMSCWFQLPYFGFTIWDLFEQDGPILKDAKTRPISRDNLANKMVSQKTEFSIDKNCLERWKVTGVIALAECKLKV